jgi:hypothetical protein
MIKHLKQFGPFFRYRKLKVQWTVDMAQELQTYYNFDAEAELVSILQEEIDKQNIERILNGEY